VHLLIELTQPGVYQTTGGGASHHHVTYPSDGSSRKTGSEIIIKDNGTYID
jgi:hypothetical protein